MIHFSDMNADRIRKVLETQKGIIEFANWAATVLAEAGIASSKAVGDSPQYACRRWSEVILEEALRIVDEREPNAKIDAARKRFKYVAAKRALTDDRAPDR